MSEQDTRALGRRDFGRLAGAGLLASLAPGAAAQTPPRAPASATAGKLRMKLGTQHGSSDEILTVLAALGVNHICAELPSARLDPEWSVESLLRKGIDERRRGPSAQALVAAS